MNSGLTFRNTIWRLLCAGLHILTIGCCVSDSRLQPVPGLYAYNSLEMDRQMQRVLKKVGAAASEQCDPRIARSADGLALYERSNHNILIVKGSDTHVIVDAKGERPYLDGKQRVVAWREEREVHFSTGAIRKVSGSGFGVDLIGRFCFLTRPEAGMTEIMVTTDPNTVLTKVPIEARAIYSRGDEVLVFGNYNYYAKYYDNKEIIYWRLRFNSGSILDSQEFRIPRAVAGPSPFAVRDVDSDLKRALIVDVRDDPGCSKWLIYHLDSQVLEPIGPARAYGFFLQKDVFQ